jgi:hypothetical protein
MSDVSREMSNETRAKPVRGGKDTCCVAGCNEPHYRHSGYCKTHKRLYQNRWAHNRTAELKRLRAQVEGQSDGEGKAQARRRVD